MVERRNDQDIRDRLKTVEIKLDNHAIQMADIVTGQDAANDKLDRIIITMAEQRGAGKAAKVIGSAALGLISIVGGFLGSMAHGVMPK